MNPTNADYCTPLEITKGKILDYLIKKGKGGATIN
jgi:hypothetical protein